MGPIMRLHVSLIWQSGPFIAAIMVCIFAHVADIILGTMRGASATVPPPAAAPRRAASTCLPRIDFVLNIGFASFTGSDQRMVLASASETNERAKGIHLKVDAADWAWEQ